MFFYKKASRFFWLLILSTNLLAVVPGENGIETFKEGRREHTYINASSPIFSGDLSLASQELKSFVEKCSIIEPKNAVYFQLPFAKGHLMPILVSAGFKFEAVWYTTPEGSEERIPNGLIWIIKNKSSVPPQSTFTHTSRLGVIDKNGFVLLVQKGPVKTFPGGIADSTENPLVTAHREFKEEVGVDLNINAFVQLGVLHRTPQSDLQGPKEAGDTSFYYAYVIENKDHLKLTIQEDEISWAGWVHWSEIVQSNDVGGHIKLMVEKICKGTLNDESLVYELPDFHTLYRSPAKESAAKIWNKTMSMTMSKMPPLLDIK